MHTARLKIPKTFERVRDETFCLESSLVVVSATNESLDFGKLAVSRELFRVFELLGKVPVRSVEQRVCLLLD